MVKAFKFRLYPNREQRDKMNATLDACRELYNAGLAERIGAWKNRTPVDCFAQINQLPEIKEVRTELRAVYSHAMQDVSRRLEKAYKAFFLRVKKGQNPGFPRFKSRNRFDSFTYPDGFKLVGSRLQLSKIGNIKVKLHREVEGKIKTATIKRECGAWFVTLAVEFEPKPLPHLDNAVGIDAGLESFAVLSDGTTIPNPHFYSKTQAALCRAQRRAARRKKGSHGRRKGVELLQKIHLRIFNQRADFQHKVSHQIVRDFGKIAIEDAGEMLAKSVHAVGWAGFSSKLSYKAAHAGRTLRLTQSNRAGTQPLDANVGAFSPA